MVPLPCSCCWTAPPLGGVCQIVVELAPAPDASSMRWPAAAGMVCAMLHCLVWIHDRGATLRPYIPYYNRTATLSCTASGVAVVSGMCWRCYGAVIRSSVAQAIRYSRIRPPNNSGKTRQIAGKSTVKPCALFCGVGGITALTEQNAL